MLTLLCWGEFHRFEQDLSSQLTPQIFTAVAGEMHLLQPQQYWQPVNAFICTVYLFLPLALERLLITKPCYHHTNALKLYHREGCQGKLFDQIPHATGKEPENKNLFFSL